MMKKQIMEYASGNEMAAIAIKQIAVAGYRLAAVLNSLF